MDWQQMWGGVNGRFPFLPAAGDVFSKATEAQQQPKRDAAASQVPISDQQRLQTGLQVMDNPELRDALRTYTDGVQPAEGPLTEAPAGSGVAFGRPDLFKGLAPQSAHAEVSRVDGATSGLTPATAGGPRSEEDLNLARRRAFLDSKDSLGGARAVRGVLADEVQARGGGERPDPMQTSVRKLEDRLAELQQQGRAYTDQTMTPSFGESVEAGKDPQLGEAIKKTAGGASMKPDWLPDDAYARPLAQERFGDAAPVASAPMASAPVAPAPMASAGGGAQAAVNAWMQTGLRDSLQREPLDQPASWQINPTPLPGPKTDAWRESGLASAAAAGVEMPGSEGEAVARAFTTGPMGSRNGMFKPGNTMPLGFYDGLKLPPIGSRVSVSGPAARR